jgi:hypothetical protein
MNGKKGLGLENLIKIAGGEKARQRPGGVKKSDGV